MASVTDLQANVDWSRLLRQLELGNIEGAIAALNIAPAAFAEYAAVKSEAFAKAGASTVAQIRQAGVAPIGMRFNMQDPRAQQWIAESVAEQVVGFAEEQVQVARRVIGEGYAAGRGPRDIATDLAGRVVGGRRQGGVLGLDGPRAERLRKVVVGMRTPEGVRGLVIQHDNGAVSLRYKVNKATAQRILKAYRAGSEVPPGDRLISERQYSNALKLARAETVARTETASAVMGGRDETWQQLVESQGLTTDAVIKRWEHRGGASVHHRPDHLAMSGVEVRGLNTPFIFPDGSVLQYSHDPRGGPAHVINCRCSVEYRLDHAVGLG